MSNAVFKHIGLAGAAAMALFSGAAHAANASASATMGVTVPVTITKTADLQFGSVMRPAAGWGNFAIAATDGATATCDSGLVCSGTSAPAKFTITGNPGAVVLTSVDQTVIVRNGNAAVSVTLTANPVYVNTLNAGGQAELIVGGYMYIQSDTVAGQYSGTFNVVANYQ